MDIIFQYYGILVNLYKKLSEHYTSRITELRYDKSAII